LATDHDASFVVVALVVVVVVVLLLLVVDAASRLVARESDERNNNQRSRIILPCPFNEVGAPHLLVPMPMVPVETTIIIIVTD
jgi:hypothetical protein